MADMRVGSDANSDAGGHQQSDVVSGALTKHNASSAIF